LQQPARWQALHIALLQRRQQDLLQQQQQQQPHTAAAAVLHLKWSRLCHQLRALGT
jgi:hypothetical protein